MMISDRRSGLLPFAGKLLQFVLEPGEDGVDVLLACHHFCIAEDKNSIIRTDVRPARASLAQSFSSEPPTVALLHCAAVAIEPYGLRRPVILTSLSRSGHDTCFTGHVYSPETNSLVRLDSFTFKGTQLGCDRLFPSVADGPTFFFQRGNLIWVSIWDGRCSRFRVIHSDSASPVQCSIKAISRDRSGLLLILASNDKPNTSEDISDLLGCKESESHPWQLVRVDLDGFKSYTSCRQIPSSYSSITRALYPLGDCSEGSFEEGLLLATSLSQLVLIDSGGCVSVRDIPFGDAVSVSTANIGEHGDTVLVESEANGVYLVDLRTLSVERHFPGYKAAFLDDFLRVGSDQLLLVKDTDKFEDAGGFMLTDLTNTWPQQQEATAVRNTKEGGEALQSMLSAVNALTHRLQISTNVLHSLEVQSYQKKLVLDKSRETLQATLQGRSIHQAQPDLTCIIGDEPEGQSAVGPSADGAVMSPGGTEPNAQNLWRRIVRERLVVGALVANTADSSISDIHIFLVCMNPPSDSPHSLVQHGRMVHSSTGGPGGTMDSGHLAPGGKVWVTTTMDCPMFDSSPVFRYSIALMWTEWAGEESKQRQRCIQSCSLSFAELDKLSVKLSREKISSGEFTNADHLALNSVQQLTRLFLSSKHTAVRTTPDRICKELGFILVTMDTREELLCEAGHLEGVRFYQRSISQTSANLEVYTWDNKQLVLFLRALYSILPTDATITPPSHDESTREQCKNLAKKQLANEVDELKRFVKLDKKGLKEQGFSGDFLLETDRSMVALSELT